MSNAPLTIRFATDVDSAKKGIASLATSIATNMASVAGSALAAGRNVTSAGTTIINVFTQINKASSLAVPALGALALGAAATYVAFAAAAAITNLAKERLQEYVDIADKAAKGGVTPEFFQRQAKAAEQYRISLDDVAASAAKFRDVSAPKLGGSDLQQRLDQLTEAGNFKNNTYLGAFRTSSTDEERYRAFVGLITQAAEQGERLAALDLAAKFLPPEMLDRLRSSSDFLATLQKNADDLSKTQIVSNEDIARAISLNQRLEDAQKTLSEKFKPIQNDLVQLGMNYHENWVSIVETMASAVEQAQKLYSALSNKPKWLEDAGNSSFWSWLTEHTTTPEGRAEAEARYGLTRGSAQDNPEGPEMTAAKARLTGGLQNPASVRLAGEATTNIAYDVRGDTSIAPKKEEAKERLDQIEALINRMQKSNDTLKVELDTEGKSNIEREKGVALANADAAARAAGRDLTEDERQKVLQLAEAHATLANRLKDVQQQLQQNAETARFFGSTAATALGDIFIDGQKASDVLANLVKSFAKLALQAAFTGTGSLAGVLGLAPSASAGPNAVGGFSGLLMKAFGLNTGSEENPGSSLFPLPGLSSDDYGVGFDSGGYTGPGGKYQVAGKVHKDEFVFNKEDVGRIGLGNLMRIRAGQAGSPGGVGAPSFQQSFAPAYYINAAGADSGTVNRIFSVLGKHAGLISQQGRALLSAQRYQTTGVS